MSRTKKPSKWSRACEIIKGVALAGGLITVSLVAPLAGSELARSITKHYLRKSRSLRSDLLRDLKRLQRRELINFQDLGGDKIRITLSRRGKQISLEYKLDELKLKPQSRWDGLWRLVIFDIPHSKKRARDALRKKLRDLGFYQMQKSVFITPHPCEDEIDFISSVFNVRQNILILYINRFEGQKRLAQHFGL